MRTRLRNPTGSITIGGEGYRVMTCREFTELIAGFLGKKLAQNIIPELQAADDAGLAHDSSTNALIRRYRRLRSS